MCVCVCVCLGAGEGMRGAGGCSWVGDRGQRYGGLTLLLRATINKHV